MKILHWIISVSIILFNAFHFLDITFNILKTCGGGMGFGYLLLPFILPINFLLITAFMSFNEKFADHNFIFLINLFGLLWTIFCFLF